MYAPDRRTGVKVMLDANVINARQRDPAVNQLERWREDEVIVLLMPEVANEEAAAGNDPRRFEKAAQFVSTNSALISEEQRRRYSAIEQILFPPGVRAEGERNDVDIVYQAADWGYILVTNDGDSRRQPRGILGCRSELAAEGARIMRPQEAVDYICQQIRERDAREESNCDALGVPRPQWLGVDLPPSA
jgi:hypothetical protein